MLYCCEALRAVLEKLARGEKRALLSLATGAGKTRIAVNLLKRIADAGLLRRALFVCDRDELRSQGLGAFQNVFGADAAPVSGGNPQKNARILIATPPIRFLAKPLTPTKTASVLWRAQQEHPAAGWIHSPLQSPTLRVFGNQPDRHGWS